ncbi:MAG: glycosyltransferase family 39 protein [Pirellulaceae bacterium]
MFSRAALPLLAVLLLFTNLGAPRLWDRDEPRNAGCAAEMLRTNNWSVPVFNGELRTHKPILLYWAMLGSYTVFGVNEFAARLPSALFALSSLGLTYGIARRLFDKRIAIGSVIVLSSTLMFNVAARAATPDSALIFCVTLSLYLFVCENGLQQPYGSKTWSHWALYASLGLGVLAKGPIGFVLPICIVGLTCMLANWPDVLRTENRWQTILRIARCTPLHFLRTAIAMRPVSGVITALVVCVPWYAYVGYRTGGVWLTEFFWQHNVSRAVSPMEGHSGPPVLYYLVAILVGFFPWSVLAAPATAFTVRHFRSLDPHASERLSIRFLCCWLGVWVGAFSLAGTKLPSYVTPCYPAIAILVSWFVCHVAEATAWRPLIRLLKLSNATLVLVGATILIAVPIAIHQLAPGSEWLGVLGLVPLLGGTLGWIRLTQSRFTAAMQWLGGTSLLFCWLLFGFGAVQISRNQQYVEFLGPIRTDDRPVLAWGSLEPSWVFYAKQNISFFTTNQSDALRQYFSQSEHQDVYALVPRHLLREFPVAKGQAVREIHSTRYFLKEAEVVLLHVQTIPATRPELAQQDSRHLQ